MKKLIALTSALLLFGFAACFGANAVDETTISKKDMPQAILDAFGKAYPKATVKGFSKETEGEKVLYEIESSEGELQRDVTYNPDGTVVSVEETMPVGEFPEAVRNAMNKDYPNAKVKKSEKIVKGETVQYEVLLKTDKKTFEVVFNPDGTVAKTEEKKKHEKD